MFQEVVAPLCVIWFTPCATLSTYQVVSLKPMAN